MKSLRWKRRQTREMARNFGYFMAFVATAFLLSWLDSQRRNVRARPRVPKTADERTMRRIAEAQAGGMSTEEGRARYERGEHRGGLHGKAVPLPPDDESFEDEEPHDRLEIHHGGQRAAMPAMRR